MRTVTSFHASAVDPHRIGAILADYFELERLRAYRRRFVARFGALALVLAVLGFGLHWLSAGASWATVTLCAMAPVWAWVAELRCEWRLGRSLDELPPDARRTVGPAWPVRKS